MRKFIFGLIMLVPVLMSCEEDEEKVIQTDLPTEAAQLFNTSKNWYESLYFATISWEEFQNVDSLNLPSCPAVHLNKETKEVTLDFMTSPTCEQAGEYGRSGKLILAFDTTAVSPNRKWSMKYVDYIFETDTIKGIRNFSSDDSLVFSEEFIELIEKAENGSTTKFSGQFVHAKTFLGDSLANLSSAGRITGTNPVGRHFEIIIDNPVTHSITCFQHNEILPGTGKENWLVSRGGNSVVNYTTTYEPLLDTCKVAVNTILPDGRKLLLNPKE